MFERFLVPNPTVRAGWLRLLTEADPQGFGDVFSVFLPRPAIRTLLQRAQVPEQRMLIVAFERLIQQVRELLDRFPSHPDTPKERRQCRQVLPPKPWYGCLSLHRDAPAR